MIPAAASSIIHLPECGGGTWQAASAYQTRLTVDIITVVQLAHRIPERPLPVLTEVI